VGKARGKKKIREGFGGWELEVRGSNEEGRETSARLPTASLLIRTSNLEPRTSNLKLGTLLLHMLAALSFIYSPAYARMPGTPFSPMNRPVHA
jgi:hypothetical protein